MTTPWAVLDVASVPGGENEMRLLRRNDEFSIQLGRNELMNSRVRGSEEALARLACTKLPPSSRPHLLIGGLGMGFTLRAALDVVGSTAEVVVAELVPAVATWCRGPLAHLSDNSLADPRVRLRHEDVALTIRASPGVYDVVLLDVDNGPGGLTRRGNDALYTLDGLQAARTALRPGGILGIWSAHHDRAFAACLRQTGFHVVETTVRGHNGRGARSTVWLARTPDRVSHL